MAERSDEIRREIEERRREMGETVDALGYKADVKSRAGDWVGDRKDALLGKKDAAVSKVADVTPDRRAIQRRGGRVKSTAERNPLGLAIAGAALGFLAGIAAPSTEMENERIGPMADDVKSTAAEAGQEALQHGREVVQSAARSAVETGRDEGQEHGRRLAESVAGEEHDGGRAEQKPVPPAPYGSL